MTLLLQSLGFGLAVAFMVVGIAGILIPLVPGTLLIWLTLLVYALLDQFQALDGLTFGLLTLVALSTGTADFWLPLLGAKATGASRRAMLLGTLAALAGFLVFNLIGAILGYALGVVLGEYSARRDWRAALKASLGGLAGMGVSTLVQLGGGLLMLIIFVWQVLSYP